MISAVFAQQSRLGILQLADEIGAAAVMMA